MLSSLEMDNSMPGGRFGTISLLIRRLISALISTALRPAIFTIPRLTPGLPL